MNHYFAGYNNKVPCVYVDDGMGMVKIHLKNRRTIQAAHNIAKVRNAHERKKKRKSPQ
jgi:hypothetical protein